MRATRSTTRTTESPRQSKGFTRPNLATPSATAPVPAPAPLHPGRRIYTVIQIQLIHYERSEVQHSLTICGIYSTLHAADAAVKNATAKNAWWEHSPDADHEIPAASMFEGTEPPDVERSFGGREFYFEGETRDGRKWYKYRDAVGCGAEVRVDVMEMDRKVDLEYDLRVRPRAEDGL